MGKTVWHKVQYNPVIKLMIKRYVERHDKVKQKVQTLKWVQEATTTPSAAAAVLMLAPPGGIHTSSLPRTTCSAEPLLSDKTQPSPDKRLVQLSA